jgi:hypothetical protein
MHSKQLLLLCDHQRWAVDSVMPVGADSKQRGGRPCLQAVKTALVLVSTRIACSVLNC